MLGGDLGQAILKTVALRQSLSTRTDQIFMRQKDELHSKSSTFMLSAMIKFNKKAAHGSAAATTAVFRAWHRGLLFFCLGTSTSGDGVVGVLLFPGGIASVHRSNQLILYQGHTGSPATMKSMNQ